MSNKIFLTIISFICFSMILIIAPNLSTTTISYFNIIALSLSMLILHWTLYKYFEKPFIFLSKFSKINKGILFVMCLGYLYLFIGISLPFWEDEKVNIIPKYNVYIALFMIMVSSLSDIKKKDNLGVSANSDTAAAESE